MKPDCFCNFKIAELELELPSQVRSLSCPSQSCRRPTLSIIFHRCLFLLFFTYVNFWRECRPPLIALLVWPTSKNQPPTWWSEVAFDKTQMGNSNSKPGCTGSTKFVTLIFGHQRELYTSGKITGAVRLLKGQEVLPDDSTLEQLGIIDGSTCQYRHWTR